MNRTANQGTSRGLKQVSAPPGRDEIRASFLERQYEEITELAAHSDVVEVFRHGPVPPDRYILRFHCQGLVKTGAGITEADQFDFGLNFPEDYLRRAEVTEVITVLGPREIFHPNVRYPFICIGKLRPGTGIRDLVYQLYEMITFYRVTMREDDALDHQACVWARNNQARFPLENRPLRRRELTLRVSRDAAGSAGGEDANGAPEDSEEGARGAGGGGGVNRADSAGGTGGVSGTAGAGGADESVAEHPSPCPAEGTDHVAGH
jgi:hypothetical protein